MRTTSTLAGVIAHAGLGAAAAFAGCHENNCYRQSFLRTTVVPPTVTDWVTQTTVDTVVQTNTVTVTAASNNNAPARRDTAASATIAPSKVPAYASSCADAAAYSSACLCASATRATVTAPTPTVTSTQTLSVTATVQVTAHATVTVDATATQTATVTATVTPPPASCTRLVLDNSPPPGSDCARRGWRDAVKAPVVGYGDGASVEACASSCKANPACKAVIYGDPARGWPNFCELEAAPNGRADSADTPFWWYDMSCFKLSAEYSQSTFLACGLLVVSSVPGPYGTSERRDDWHLAVFGVAKTPSVEPEEENLEATSRAQPAA
ncbi:PAN domain-containing protein [Purpureocillium lavendulum]|uniref:PAN domain-containing protein n=1 Tax=Purpureocillium lavendulum TaxID=1247861 RepID=A0AB34FWI8_9HYPO|nr:PAN domain-containing protein [Purpureocillium lavendulum]